MRIPVRCAEAGKGWHQVHAVAALDAARQGFDFGGSLDDAETIAQPLHYGAADEDTAFQRVVNLVADFPGDRSQQIVFRDDRLGAGIHHHEATGTVSILDHAGLGTHLPEQCGLLVTGNPGQRNLRTETGNFGMAVNFTGGTHFRQHAARYAHDLEQFVVPLHGVDIEQHGA